MKLIYHHRTLAGDAQGIHIRTMIKAFQRLGHHVETVALVPPGLKETRSGETSIKGLSAFIRRTPRWSYEFATITYNLVGLQLLDRAIHRIRPDFIYERYSLNTVCGILAARRHGIPLILEVNSPLHHEQAALGQLSFRRLARLTEKWICSHASHTITVTEVLRKLLAEDGVPLDRMTVMHNGVDPKEINPDIKGDRVRAKYGLADSTVLGFVGWFRRWHGLEMLFEAADVQDLLKHNVRILLVGDGPALNDLRKMVSTRALEKIVVFTGPIRREEMAEHIAAMDVALQPSAPVYACPMKIIEAMGMARCIIAPRQPNILELLEDNSTALLFDPGSVHGMQSAILRAVGDPGLRVRIGRMAYETLRLQGLYWTRNAERVTALAFALQRHLPNNGQVPCSTL